MYCCATISFIDSHAINVKDNTGQEAPSGTLVIYFDTTGYLLRYQAFHPPFKAYTLVYPLSMSFRAKLALVPSLGQAQ